MRRLLLLLLIATSAEAADQKILIPVYYNGPGAGTLWRTALVIENKMSQGFRSPGTTFATQCPIPEGCFVDTIPAGQLGFLVLTTAPGGLLLMAPADEADKLVMRLEIAAIPRNPLVGVGTAIPIVRERDFRTSTVTLLDVAVGAGNRARVRVYDPDSNDGAQVRVSIRPWSSSAAIDSRTVPLHVLPRVGTSTPLPAPAYAEFDVAETFPAAAMTGFNFNIDVEPLTSGLRFWAFATVTTSANDVTAIWPQ